MKIPSENEMKKALYDRIGKEHQRKFEDTTVAVCGLGGLGSNIAISLARAGIGKLILIDFDKIDITNLNRQQYKFCQIGRYKTDALLENIKEISPYTKIQTHTVKLNENNYYTLLSPADIICEAFDAAEEKSKLVDFVMEKMADKYLVAASGMAGLGSANSIKTKKITNYFYLCGDGVSDVGNGDTLYSSRVMLCASHQAHTVLRIISEKFDI